MLRNTEESIEILKSINFLDSAIFGLSIDIFKVRLLISCDLSPDLASFGYSEHPDLCFDFRDVSSLEFSIHKSLFGPAYLEDGDLALINFADFDNEILDMRKVGKTMLLSYKSEGKIVDQYEVNFPFRQNGSVKFRFADLRVETFVPESLDR